MYGLKRLGERVTACILERQMVDLPVQIVLFKRFSQAGLPQIVVVA